MREIREQNKRESEIRKRAVSDAVKYLKQTTDTEMLYTKILDPIAEKAYKESDIKKSSGKMELYIATLVDATGIKTE